MLLAGYLEQHAPNLQLAPERVAADPGFFSVANEFRAEQSGVRRVSIASHDTKRAAGKQRQKRRWFKELQKWRTSCASVFSNAGTGCHPPTAP